ncbi:MAG TPA: P-II family nitrogen regulator [Nitrososphaerales archaeon]|nr:P-II family nitrogen regulator [Nitrososphaerales archaeon]HUK75669.1 P-II family nitrogen regulator [Nitrososphaerales archaeon]
MPDSDMRMIEAVFRAEKFGVVDKALRDLGVSGVTMMEAKGRGRDTVITHSFVRGKWTWTTDVIHRVIVEVVVSSADVDKVIKAVVKAASTKKVGDGKIFVHTIEESVDISTGDADDHSLKG